MATTKATEKTVIIIILTGKDPQKDNPQGQVDHQEELEETQQRDTEKDQDIEIVETVVENPEQTPKRGQVTEKEVLEDRELTPQKGQDTEDLESTLQIDQTRESLEKQEEIEMIPEREEKIRGVEEGIMIQDKMEIIQTTVPEEKTEEGMAGETMTLADPTQPATGTHEISARRFHTWGNLQ